MCLALIIRLLSGNIFALYFLLFFILLSTNFRRKDVFPPSGAIRSNFDVMQRGQQFFLCCIAISAWAKGYLIHEV
jgi:hypothetical protein